MFLELNNIGSVWTAAITNTRIEQSPVAIHRDQWEWSATEQGPTIGRDLVPCSMTVHQKGCLQRGTVEGHSLLPPTYLPFSGPRGQYTSVIWGHKWLQTAILMRGSPVKNSVSNKALNKEAHVIYIFGFVFIHSFWGKQNCWNGPLSVCMWLHNAKRDFNDNILYLIISVVWSFRGFKRKKNTVIRDWWGNKLSKSP